jgi:hypothetical protein
MYHWDRSCREHVHKRSDRAARADLSSGFGHQNHLFMTGIRRERTPVSHCVFERLED